MNIIITCIAFFALVQLIVGVFLLFSRFRRLTGTLYAFHILSSGLWAIGMIFYYIIPEIQAGYVLGWTRFLYLFGVLAPINFFGFTYFFTQNRNIKNTPLLFIISFFTILFFILIFATDTIVSGIEFHPGNREVLHGRLYPLFFITLFTAFFASFFLLFKQFFSTKKEILKQQTKLIMLASIPALTIAGIVNMILPVFWGNFTYVWIGPMVLPTSAFTIYYAISRYRFLNIKFNLINFVKNATAIFITSAVVYFLYLGISHFAQTTYYAKLIISFSVVATIFSILFYLAIIRLLNSQIFYDIVGTTSVEYFKKITSDLQARKNVYATALELECALQKIFCTKLKIESAHLLILRKGIQKNYPHLLKYCEKHKEILVTKELKFLQTHENKKIPFLKELKSLGEICLPLLHYPSQKLIGFLILGKKLFDHVYSSEEIKALESLRTYFSLALMNIIYNYKLKAEVLKLSEVVASTVDVTQHELRTPINVIKTALEIMKHDQRFQDSSKEIIEHAHNAAQKLYFIVEKIIEAQRCAKGTALELSEFNIYSFLSEIKENFVASMLQQKIKFKLNLEMPKNTFISADKERLWLVFSNLLNNAQKFTTEGGQVSLHAKPKDQDNLLIKVIDTGEGVPDDKKDFIFERFSTAHHNKGIALGLYICRSIIKFHGGKIWCENTKGGGATFCVELPIKSSAEKFQKS